MSDAAKAVRLPSKKVNAGRVSQELRGNELYPTSPVATQALLATSEVFPANLWEPMGGLGHMATVLRGAGYSVFCSDKIDYGWPLDEVKDFFSYPRPPISDAAIITNPAFSVSAKFVRRGLELCKTVYILNRLAFLEGNTRCDIIDGHLTKVYPFINRLPMMHRWSFDPITFTWREWQGRKATSATAMAWFKFERDKTAPTVLERIAWRKGCVICHKPIAGGRVDSLYCSDSCKYKAANRRRVSTT